MKRLTDLTSAFHPGTTVLVGTSTLLLAGLFAGWHLSTWPVRLRYPGELNFVEGMRLAEMVHLRQGVPIYAPFSPKRFDAAIYGPLYYLLGARLVDPARPAYRPLRVVSMLGTLGCAATCGLLAFWLSRSHFAAVLAPLTFLAYGFVTTHGISARSDMVALGLFLAGFLLAYRFQQDRRLVLAAPFMVLGFYYKQQFVAGPLAVLLYLVLERRYRRAAEFGGLLALGGGGLLAVFEWLVFPGQSFVRHFLVYNFVPFAWTPFGVGMVFFVLILLVPVLVGLEYLRVYRDRLLCCYLGCGLLLSLLATAKEGSDSNYFIECILILSALFAALIGKRISEPMRAAELLILLGVSLFFGQQWFTIPCPEAEDFSRDRAMQDYLRRNFTSRTSALGYYTGDLLRAGLDTPVSDLYQYAQLIRKGTLSDQDLLAQLRQHRFGLVIVSFDLQTEIKFDWSNNYVTESLQRAIVENYQLADSMEMPRPEKFKDNDRFYIWVPRARVPASRNKVLPRDVES